MAGVDLSDSDAVEKAKTVRYLCLRCDVAGMAQSDELACWNCGLADKLKEPFFLGMACGHHWDRSRVMPTDIDEVKELSWHEFMSGGF